MSARLSTVQIAMDNHQDRTSRMPSSRFSMPAMCMFAAATAAASIIIRRTDVLTSVSLFVWLLLVLVTLVLISLLLTGLTGLIRLESLVGLITERAANKAQGV